MTQEIHRELGAHDARLDSLEKELHAAREDMRRIFEKLDSINTTLAEAKGGWRTFMAVGGAGVAIGGFLISVLHYFWPR